VALRTASLAEKQRSARFGIAGNRGFAQGQDPRLDKGNHLIQLGSGHGEGRHAAIGDSMLDQVAKGLFIVQPPFRPAGDGGRPLAAETILAMATGASDIEAGTPGLDRIAGGHGLLRHAGVQHGGKQKHGAAQAGNCSQFSPLISNMRVTERRSQKATLFQQLILGKRPVPTPT
jgi:hypothetical protein